MGASVDARLGRASVVVCRGSGGPWTYKVVVPSGVVFDRVQLREDTITGQRVRNYTVAVDNVTVAKGQAIGTPSLGCPAT